MQAYGTTIQIGIDNISFIASVIGVTPPSASRESIDMTHIGTEDAKIFQPAKLVDWGEMSVDVIFDPATVPEIAGTTQYVIITYPDATLFGFNAFVSGFEPSVPQDDKATATITMKVSGAAEVLVGGAELVENGTFPYGASAFDGWDPGNWVSVDGTPDYARFTWDGTGSVPASYMLNTDLSVETETLYLISVDILAPIKPASAYLIVDIGGYSRPVPSSFYGHTTFKRFKFVARTLGIDRLGPLGIYVETPIAEAVDFGITNISVKELTIVEE